MTEHVKDEKLEQEKDICHCSFCNKTREQVTNMVAGPSVYICNECVDFCTMVLRNPVKSTPRASLDTANIRMKAFEIVSPWVKRDGSPTAIADRFLWAEEILRWAFIDNLFKDNEETRGQTISVKPIKTNEDYEEALVRIRILMDMKKDTHATDELDVLTTLVEVYEKENFSIAAPNIFTILNNHMEQRRLTPHDLGMVIDNHSIVTDMMAYGNAGNLTLKHLDMLNKAWGLNLGVTTLSFNRKGDTVDKSKTQGV